MEDITGLGKLADSQLVNKGYDDLASGAMQETGKAATDLAKAMRLFTAPIQLLAVAQDRLAAYCDRARSRVPEERQIEAQPSIAIPILLGLRQTEDGNPLVELYLGLLQKAIDREQVGLVHPAFPRLVEQLSPDEAMLIYGAQVEGLTCVHPDARQHNSFPMELLMYPDQLRFYISHLASLNLVHDITPSFFELTQFGFAFRQACLPPDFDPQAYKQSDRDTSTLAE